MNVSMYSVITHLVTEVKVGYDNGRLRAGDDEDHKHQEEETKQVEVLVLPEGLGRGGGEGELPCGNYVQIFACVEYHVYTTSASDTVTYEHEEWLRTTL